MGQLADLFKDYKFTVGFVILCLLMTFAICSIFAPYDPTRWLQVPRNRPPSWPHILGTNSKGQDVFWQATFAIRNSLIIALLAGLVSRVIAVLVGFIAGHKGGLTDRVLTSISDGMLVIPLFLILVLLASLLQDRMTLVNTALLLAFFGWAWDARTIRAQILSLREREFTRTAILSGANTLSLVRNEYLPYSMPLIFSTLINNMAWVISIEVTLAILGLANLDIPTLGTMLHWALFYQAILLEYWWWILTPIVLTILLVVALYWLSVSISEYLDPRMRIQRIGVRGGTDGLGT